jgi:DNA-binding PadR family transcriptional regulator
MNMQLAKSANIRGESQDRDVCFNHKTGGLNSETLQRCETLQRHGFTVVEVPRDWRYGYHGIEGGWKVFVIQRALERVAAIYERSQGSETMSGYDPELAQAVLIELNKSYPYPISNVELKHSLGSEPSDESLLTALDALQLEGLVSGKSLRDNQSGKRRLAAMANIQITAEGRKQLTTQPQSEPHVALNISGGTFHHSPIGAGYQVDQRVNVTFSSSEELFANFRAEVTKLVEDRNKREVIMARIDDLEAAHDEPSKADRYLKLMGAIGDHITVLGFLLPPITHWITSSGVH